MCSNSCILLNNRTDECFTLKELQQSKCDVTYLYMTWLIHMTWRHTTHSYMEAEREKDEVTHKLTLDLNYSSTHSRIQCSLTKNLVASTRVFSVSIIHSLTYSLTFSLTHTHKLSISHILKKRCKTLRITDTYRHIQTHVHINTHTHRKTHTQTQWDRHNPAYIETNRPDCTRHAHTHTYRHKKKYRQRQSQWLPAHYQCSLILLTYK